MTNSISETGRPLFIAEAGTGHNGDLQKALDMIDAASEAGADYVKFQYVIAREIIHPLTGVVPLPGGDTALYDVFRKLEQPPDFYAALQEYCQKRSIRFLCSPFGLESARNLHQMGVEALKIASPELNHFQLLAEVDSYNLPIFLSTGVSELKDIREALAVLSRKPVLLHCITSYPAPEEEYNVSVIRNMATEYQTPCGLSDHSLHPWLVPALAALYDAYIIEKHLALSKSGNGLDDPIALTPSEFAEMIHYTKKISLAGFDTGIDIMNQEFGAERIAAICGNGKKELSPSEYGNYGRTNRSVHALIQIPKGSILTENNTAILRTEKILRPGCSPALYNSLLGKKAARTIPSGDGIHPRDVES